MHIPHLCPVVRGRNGGAVTTELRSRLNRALASGHLPQLRHQPTGRYTIREGVILSAYDIPGPIFNTAAVFDPAVHPQRAFAVAREFFGSERGWSVLAEADAGHPIEEWLQSRGWSVIGETPAMALSPIPPAPPLPWELTIRVVVDDRGLRDYLSPLGEPSGPAATTAPDAEPLIPPNVDELLVRSLALAQDPDVALLVGYVGGRVAGTSALYRTNGVAEIGGVGVAPSFRRRGFGAALTSAALSEGAARGCDAGALHSTEMGYSVYRRMGFRPLAVHRRYADRTYPPAPPLRGKGRRGR